MVSVFGGFIGILALALAAPAVSGLALMFAPRDYLMLAIWGILLVGALSGGSLAKGIFAGAVGVLIGMVGLDPMTAEPRFTFGSVQMTAGISYVAAMIGFFGVAEVLVQLHELSVKAVKQDVTKILPSWGPAEEVPAAVAAHLHHRGGGGSPARGRRRHRRADGL